MLKDARELEVSTNSHEAIALYEKALAQYHDYFGDPVETIEQALKVAPDFLLGHVFRATMFLVLAEKHFRYEINDSLQNAYALTDKGNERERALLKAAQLYAKGDWHTASVAYEKILIDHPRDAFAAQTGHLLDFFRGDAVNLRDRIARILPAYDRDTPSYSYLLGMYAFGLEECNEYARAEQAAFDALALQRRDPWAIHAIAHVLEMQGRHEEGIRLYNEREQDWAQDNGFAFHNWWHLSLYHIERDEYDKVLQIYDAHVAPNEEAFVLGLIDATAMLWRLQLHGVDVGSRWTPVAELWAQRNDRGFYAFNDAHAMMAYCGAGKFDIANDLLTHVSRVAETGDPHNSNTAMSRDVGLPVCNAVLSFTKGQYSDSVTQLLPIRTQANRFGGSNAQRDILSQTLLAAAIKGGQHQLAKHLLNERFARKPESPLAWRFAARNFGAMGNNEQAAASMRRAAELARQRKAA